MLPGSSDLLPNYAPERFLHRFAPGLAGTAYNVSLVLPSSNHISRLRLLHRNAFRAPSTSVLGFDLSRIEGSWSKEPLWWGGIQAASGLARMRSIRLLIPSRDREGAVVNS